ncbi:MAG: iron-containing alcohol dehydrogenase [Oceanospirillaceae bacterium]|nr:iron-containing alcohol dehydrogenase [Oceanospirillaceae bacterium]
MKIKPFIQYGTIDPSVLKDFVQGASIAIVCSNSVWNKSYISSVIDSLSSVYNIKLYKHMRPNAPFSDLQQIIDDYSGSKPDTIIGIGGGSVIDACKALSVCFEGNSLRDLFYKRKNLGSNSIHTIAIPTTAGTGAELSFGAILYDDLDGIKGGLRGEVLQPNVVMIDVKLYATAPPKLIAEVGFDCLTHAVETYISTKSNPIVQYQSLSTIRTVFSCLPNAVKGDLHALKQMAISSAMMGVNLAYSSTCLPHRIQYVIGPMTRTSHAQGLIALYKGWTKLLEENGSQTSLEILERDMGYDFNLRDAVKELKSKVDINYTLDTLGIKVEDVELVASKVTGNVKNDPIYENEETIVKLLKESF